MTHTDTHGSTPTLSVTLTNYNYARFLGRAIESVLKQSFTDFELIIADNASTDNSLEIIRKYAAVDSRIRVIANSENLGLVGNLIVATDAARGRYCVHLDADDWVLAEDAFARQIAMMEDNPEVSFVWSPHVCCMEDGSQTIFRYYDADMIRPGEEAVEDALKANVTHSGPLFRMSAFRAFGGYDTEFYHATDVSLASNLCAQGKVGYIDHPLYARYLHGDNTSGLTKHKVMTRELVRVIEKTCDGPFGARIPDVQRLKRDTIRHILCLFATPNVFANNYPVAITALWAAFQVRPWETVTSRQTAQLLLRMMIGGQLFQKLQTRRRMLVQPIALLSLGSSTFSEYFTEYAMLLSV